MNEPRRYRDERDLAAMHSLLMAGRKANNGTYYVHTGDLSWWLYYPPLEGDFWEHIYLWDNPGRPGQALGWVLISPDWVGLDVYIQPELRGSSLAQEMYTWAEEQALKIARQKDKHTLHAAWVQDGDEILCNHFTQRGFAPRRGYVQLMTSLQPELPQPTVAEGFTLRSGKGVPEVEMRARAQYGAFGSSVPFERYIQRMESFMHSPAYDCERDIVAVSADGQVGAFCLVWLDLANRVGHFEPVGTHPDFQRKGLGRAVILEGLQRLKKAGMQSADVVTDDDNASAIKFYETIGFRVVNHLGTYKKEV